MNDEGIEDIYQEWKRTPGDINEHLETLRRLASECDSITEFGVRAGCSTSAFLASGCRKVTSYDIEKRPETNAIKEACPWWDFRLENVLTCTIEPCDLLFLDTVHTYEQVSAELERHAHKVKRYLIFHDTILFPEINIAIYEFIEDYPCWQVLENWDNNNGLLVLERGR